MPAETDYSSTIASVGQTLAHVPHSTQVSASITYLPSPPEIASTGHSPAHVPQLTHSSVITYAMFFSSFCFFVLRRTFLTFAAIRSVGNEDAYQVLTTF